MANEAMNRLAEAVAAGAISTDLIMQAFGNGWDDIMVLGAFDGSKDAATGFVSQCLPGWDWTMHGNGQAAVWPPGTIDQQNAGVIEEDIQDQPARALLLAALHGIMRSA